MGKRICLSIVILCLVVCACPVYAALIDRGTGMIYDTDLGITWLQDANYTRTSGYDTDGLMTWSQATTWASNLIYGGYNDWRLPQILPVNGTSFNGSYLSYDGSTDYGYNIGAPGSAYPGSKGSEMAYLYYNNLGNTSVPDTHIPGLGLVNNGDFINFGGCSYWSSLEYSPSSHRAWYFDFGNGVQSHADLDMPTHDNEHPGLYAWAVRDGDTGPSASTDSDYITNLILGDTFSFDYWWEMAQEPTDFNMDVLFFRDNSWQLLGGDLNLDGSSNAWATRSFAVPEELRGLNTQIRFMVYDLGADTDPTVYLRNIASNGTAPVPEPTTLILLGSGLLGLAGMRKKLKV